MTLCEPTKRGDQVKVTFILPGSDGPVAVVGDFNCWNLAANQLRPRGDVRSVTLTPSAGRRYAFRYRRKSSPGLTVTSGRILVIVERTRCSAPQSRRCRPHRKTGVNELPLVEGGGPGTRAASKARLSWPQPGGACLRRPPARRGHQVLAAGRAVREASPPQVRHLLLPT
jgi:hypothetical protein